MATDVAEATDLARVDAKATARAELWQRFDAGEIGAAEVEARLQLLERAGDDAAVAAAATRRLPLARRVNRRVLLVGAFVLLVLAAVVGAGMVVAGGGGGSPDIGDTEVRVDPGGVAPPGGFVVIEQGGVVVGGGGGGRVVVTPAPPPPIRAQTEPAPASTLAPDTTIPTEEPGDDPPETVGTAPEE